MIHDFRATRNPLFHPNMSCVAVHVRRDDRALPGVDMMDSCRNYTILDETFTGLWIDNVSGCYFKC